MEQCTLHSNRAMKKHAHCVQKMLHWCYITNEDGSLQVPALKKGEPADTLILFNEKKTLENTTTSFQQLPWSQVPLLDK